MCSPIALTPAQAALKARIDAAQAEVTRTNRIFADAVQERTKLQNQCKDHVAKALNAAEPDCSGAVCEVCMQHLGWFCPESPDHVCHYNDEDPSDEACTFCGQPEERK